MGFWYNLVHMKLVIQRVKHASVTIDGEVHGKCDEGFLILVGIQDSDTKEIVTKMAEKVSRLRIFTDEEDKMNLSIQAIHGSILSISQFTLYADCHKGNRPSFTNAGKPEIAEPLYLFFNEELRRLGIHTEEGIFGADMKVELLNDGPVTIILDSNEVIHI